MMNKTTSVARGVSDWSLRWLTVGMLRLDLRPFSPSEVFYARFLKLLPGIQPKAREN